MDYTADELINIIKLYAAVPAQQPSYNNANMLKFINRELQTVIVPKIIQLNSAYFETYSDTTITSGSFVIPTDAIGQKLREIKIIDGESIINVPQLNIDSMIDTNSFGFYLQGNNIILQNFSDYTNLTLRMYYYKRLPEMVLVASCAKITVIGATYYTVSAVPTAFGSSPIVDIVKSTPNFDTLDTAEQTSISSTNITPTAMVSTVAVNDYICLTGQSCILQLPPECFEWVAQCVAMKLLESQGDAEGMQLSMPRYQMLEKNIVDLLSNRVKGEPKKVVRRNTLFGI